MGRQIFQLHSIMIYSYKIHLFLFFFLNPVPFLNLTFSFSRFLLYDVNTGRLSKQEIEQLKRNFEAYKMEDEKRRDRLQSKNSLENYVLAMKSTVNNWEFSDRISEAFNVKILDKCDEVMSWMNGNQVCQPDKLLVVSFSIFSQAPYFVLVLSNPLWCSL